MVISKVVYTGHLRTIATHLGSNSEIVTDAPKDNNGKGEAFSPTDLVATATASCMLTVMGIAANTHNIEMTGTEVEVTKIMASNPRRISEIHCRVLIKNSNLSDKEKSILEHTALTCPVIMSLSAEINKEITFSYA